MILACVSDVGKVKKNNEDYILIDQEDGIFILADGVGGTNGGEIASKGASKYIHEQASHFIQQHGFDALSNEVLVEIFHKANAHLYHLKEGDISINMMGTTVVLCISNGSNRGIIAHIGDSRAYLIDDQITQITKDHSIVQKMIDEEILTKEQARYSNRKHEITKALGPVNSIGNNKEDQEVITPDVISLEFKPDQTLLLCSDGLSDMLRDREIFEIVTSADSIEQACEHLLKAALDNGGMDNISIVVITGFK